MKPKNNNTWTCYLLQCSDNTLYCAITNDLEKRLAAHNAGEATDAERQALFEAMRARLEPSPIVFEFLAIMSTAPLVAWPLRPVQRLLIRAAIDIVPDWVRERLGLGVSGSLRPWQASVVHAAGALADRIVWRSGPAAQSCRRLGLPHDNLYR